MKTVDQYIKDHHSGNKSHFARSIKGKDGKPDGVTNNTVWQWIDRGFCVGADGYIFNPKMTRQVRGAK